MKALALSLAAACTALACTSAPAPAPEPPALPAVREVVYQCSRGDTVTVRYHVAQERAELVREGQAMSLKQQPSGSGFIYSNGPHTIRGKGDDLTVEIGRMVPLQCQAR